MSVAGLHYSSHANRPGTNAARPNCQSHCYYWKGYLVGILQVHAARNHYSHKFKRIITVTKPIRVDQPLLFHQKSNFRCTPSLQVLFQFLHLLKMRMCNFFMIKICHFSDYTRTSYSCGALYKGGTLLTSYYY